MRTEDFFTRLDAYYDSHDLSGAETFLKKTRQDAKESGDYGLYLSAGNELLGLYRSTAHFAEAFPIAEDLLLLMEELQLSETEHFATTLLNVATLYRAAGRNEESLAYYRQALQLYERLLSPDDYRFAGLYNNLSLLLMNLGRADEAEEACEKALGIVSLLQDAKMERATSLTNLALIKLSNGKTGEARGLLLDAVQLFESVGEASDPHYGAALAGLGEASFLTGEYEASLRYYEAALDEVRTHFGENDSYALLCENCASVCAKLGREEREREYRDKAAAVRATIG